MRPLVNGPVETYLGPGVYNKRILVQKTRMEMNIVPICVLSFSKESRGSKNRFAQKNVIIDTQLT